MKLKLAPKLTLVFILFAAVLLVGMGVLAYDSGQTALEAATIHELESTAGEKVAALDGWIQHREADISALALSSTSTRAQDFAGTIIASGNGA